MIRTLSILFITSLILTAQSIAKADATVDQQAVLITGASSGRISIIGSISETLTSATRGPYSMTKFAMEADADALADEMKAFGVHVSLIQPGAYRSNIGKSALQRMAEQNHDQEYRYDCEALIEMLDAALAEQCAGSES